MYYACPNSTICGVNSHKDPANCRAASAPTLIRNQGSQLGVLIQPSPASSTVLGKDVDTNDIDKILNDSKPPIFNFDEMDTPRIDRFLWALMESCPGYDPNTETRYSEYDDGWKLSLSMEERDENGEFPVCTISYQRNGKYENPSPEQPAMITIDANNGMLIEAKWMSSGELHSPARGEPAHLEIEYGGFYNPHTDGYEDFDSVTSTYYLHGQRCTKSAVATYYESVESGLTPEMAWEWVRQDLHQRGPEDDIWAWPEPPSAEAPPF